MHLNIMRPLAVFIALASLHALAQRDRDRADRWFPDPTERRVPVLKTNVIGWSFDGQGYELRCDDLMFGCGQPLLRSRVGAVSGRAMLLHRESGLPWQGVTVEALAELRTGAVKGAAHVVIRAEDAAGHAIAEAKSPAMEGTTSFQRHRVTLQVPPDTERLSVGFELEGTGAVFLREFQFDNTELVSH